MSLFVVKNFNVNLFMCLHLETNLSRVLISDSRSAFLKPVSQLTMSHIFQYYLCMGGPSKLQSTQGHNLCCYFSTPRRVLTDLKQKLIVISFADPLFFSKKNVFHLNLLIKLFSLCIKFFRYVSFLGNGVFFQ